MFLMGLIAGAILTVASSSASFSFAGKTNPNKNNPSPTAPVQGQASSEQANVQDRMVAYAKEIGLSESDFKGCISSDKFNQKIADEESGGTAAGINGTPGNIIYDIKTKNGLLVPGARPIDNFKKYIDAMLKNPNFKSTDPDVVQAKNVIPINTSTEHVRGNVNATIAIIEYTDYQCPFCHRVHPTIQQLLQDYGDKVMWVSRHFPLSFHPDAQPLAVGAECAADLGGNDAFWGFTDKVMAEN